MTPSTRRQPGPVSWHARSLLLLWQVLPNTSLAKDKLNRYINYSYRVMQICKQAIVSKFLCNCVCVLGVTSLALTATPLRAAEPAAHVTVDFVCRAQPASYDMSSMSISVAGKPLGGTLINVPAGLQDLRISTGRPDWHVKRIEYLDIAGPNVGAVIHQHDSQEVNRVLMFTERPSRSMLSRLLIVVDTCSAAGPSTPPPPPSPRVGAGKTCPDELTRVYQNLLEEAAELRNQVRYQQQRPLNPGDGMMNTTNAVRTAYRDDAVVVQTLAQGSPDRNAVADGLRAAGSAADKLIAHVPRSAAQLMAMLEEQQRIVGNQIGLIRERADAQGCALPAPPPPKALSSTAPRLLAAPATRVQGSSVLPRGAKLRTQQEQYYADILAAESGPAGVILYYVETDEQEQEARDREMVRKERDEEERSRRERERQATAWWAREAELQSGTVAVSVGSSAGGTQVTTPEATVRSERTLYLVQRNATRKLTFVYVGQGAVSVTPQRGAALRVTAGQSVLVTSAGATLLGSGGATSSPANPLSANPLFEAEVNRNGSDYAAFDLPQANPQQCFERCKADNSCRAWTYVKPGVQGPNARCYLKNPAPPATPNTCCVSGVIPRIIDQQVAFENNVNRQGSDYARFEMQVANSDQCFERCRGDTRCAAWTFVRPGVQGPLAVCYLKNPAPAPSPNNCCVSGMIAGAAPPLTPAVTPPTPPAPPPTTPPVQMPGGDMRYDNPSVNGVLIDHCASWGTNCGQGGANAFCRRQGHGAARSFQVKNPGRTVVLADNQVCEGGNCVGFTQVVCTGTGPVSPPPVTPPVSPPLAPPQAAASIDCWRTSNAFVEQVDNGWRGVYTRTGPDRFAVQYRHVGGETRTTSTQMFGAKQTVPGIWSVEFKRDDYPMLRADIPVGNPLVGAGSYQGGNKFTLTCVSGMITGTAPPLTPAVTPPTPPAPPPTTPPVQMPGGDMRYDNPSVNGVLIDHCASWGTNCGQGGANAFCRRQGHGAARSFQVKNPGRTVVLADNQVCEGGNCVGFTQVVCTGTGPVSPPPVTPPVSPPVAPPQAAASIDCWRTSNAFVEQVDNGWRGVYTRTGPDRFAVQYRHVGGETRTISTQMFAAKQTVPGIWSVEFKRDDYPMLRAEIPVGNPLVGAGSYQGGNKFTLTCGAR